METKQNKTDQTQLADIDTITHRLLLLSLFTIAISSIIWHCNRDKNVLHTTKPIGGDYYVNSYFSSVEVSLCPKKVKKPRWKRLRMYHI